MPKLGDAELVTPCCKGAIASEVYYNMLLLYYNMLMRNMSSSLAVPAAYQQHILIIMKYNALTS